MEYSIVNYSSVPDFDRRLDSEFYKSDNLKLEHLLFKPKSKKLGELCSLHDGPFGSELLSSSYSKNGIPALRMQNITKDGLPYLDNVEFIPEEEAERLIKHIAYPGDVVTTKIGFLGYSTVLPDTFQRYFFRRELTRIEIKDQKALLPNYLATFLNTDHGRQQAIRYSTGTTRDRVLVVNQRHMLIPIFSHKFQSYIDLIIKTSHSTLRQSGKIYEAARLFLLSELNLKNWQPKHQLSFIKNHSDIQQAERIDAEYYQPKYDEIVNAIKTYAGGWESVENITNVKSSNFNPEKDIKYKYIELSNISGNGEIMGCMAKEGQNLPSRARRIVSAGDVIVSSIEGSLESIALVNEEYDKSLCSTGFYVVHSEVLNSETLLVFLKSIAGQLQLKKGCNGTILTAINKDEFNKIILPLVSNETQTQIQQKVSESFTLRKQSKHLLECAKKAVEMAIEQDEASAMKWLEKEMQKIMDAGAGKN